MSRPTDVEIGRALNALSTTLRDQRPPQLEPERVQQIVDGAVGGESKLVYRPGGPITGELRIRDGLELVAAIGQRDGRWTVERRVRAGGSTWALP